MKSARIAAAIALLLISPLAAASSRDCAAQPARPIPPEVLNQGFFTAHPDLRWRSVGLHQYRDNRFPEALRSFTRAANYADKFSQSMVARMYWNGQGVTADRALAYAWMDLAAERRYHDFLQLRELYWGALSAGEREDAVQRGQALFAEYADAQAKPRLESALLKGRQQITGSRVGHIRPALYVQSRSGADARIPVPAALVYRDEWWKPEQYWCMQDAYWSRPLGGAVEIGLPEQIPMAPPAGR